MYVTRTIQHAVGVKNKVIISLPMYRVPACTERFSLSSGPTALSSVLDTGEDIKDMKESFFSGIE